MFAKFLHDRKVREFWEREARNSTARKVVRVSENVWHIVDPNREIELILPYGVVYKDDNDGKG